MLPDVTYIYIYIACELGQTTCTEGLEDQGIICRYLSYFMKSWLINMASPNLNKSNFGEQLLNSWGKNPAILPPQKGENQK